VLTETVCQLLGQPIDLGAERGDDGHQRTQDNGVGIRDHRGGLQLLGPQRGLDLPGAEIGVERGGRPVVVRRRSRIGTSGVPGPGRARWTGMTSASEASALPREDENRSR
jgi:hypothetical protein